MLFLVDVDVVVVVVDADVFVAALVDVVDRKVFIDPILRVSAEL